VESRASDRYLPSMATGHIERLKGGSYRVVVYAGQDPITGRKRYLKESHPTETAARAAVERLLAQVEADRLPDRSATLSVLLDRWMDLADHELTTAETTAGYVRRTVKPSLGDIPLRKLQHRVDILDRLYTHLRRCNTLCDGRAFVEHKAIGEHDCALKRCVPHECQPMSPGAVRRIHAILSAALGYAVSWGWIERNPAEFAHPPKLPRRRVQPPDPEGVAHLLNAALAADWELAVFLWLAVTTGARRGELVALRWPSVDVKRGLLRLGDNYVVRNGQQRLKGTKTQEERRLSLDSVTVQVLLDFRAARNEALSPAHLTLPDEAFVFSPDPIGCRPWHPDHFTHTYRRLASQLGMREPLKNLRHFNATQLLAAGVDLPTTAGRLGHSDGGATTLRVYASWTRPADQHAAELLAGDLESLRRKAAGAEMQAPRRLARAARPIEEVLPSVTAASTYHDVMVGLRQAIASGRLEPGDLVPTVSDLAFLYDVARSTAQRAVSALGAEGVIVRSGHRWIVAAIGSAA
jgi:integrase